MANGSCLCGAIRYRLEGPFESMAHCHCSRCRTHHGSAFATFVAAPADGFHWLAGEDRLACYEAPGGMPRYFCPDCGAKLTRPQTGSAQTFVPAGNLDECSARPIAHIYAGSKACWYEIEDEVPRFDGPPPGYPDPGLAGAPRAATTGTIEGNCLCGAVGYEIVPPALFMVHCHCSRCRRARSAAHATNLFVDVAQFRWTRGEGRVRVFDLPGAERFGQNFCSDCGSAVPRHSRKIGRVVVPAGGLATDPGVRPALHIYVGSKASWDIISDALPQFEAAAP